VKIKIGIYSTDMHFMGIKVEYADPVFTDVKSEAEYEKLSVSAVMLSGSEKPMKDKEYEIYLKNPQGEISDTPVITGVTDSNGLVTGSITMSESDACGTYAFVLRGEDIPESVEVPVVYVSKEVESNIADEIKNATDSDDIKAILEANEANLSIDLEADLDGLTEDEVFAHMAGREVSTIYEIKDLYQGAIALEKINQATAKNDIKDVLEDEKSLIIFGVNTSIVNLLTDEYKDSLASDVLALDKIESFEDAGDIINELANKSLATQLGKKAVQSDATDVTVTAGSGAEISLGLTEEISDVKKITFYIEADNVLLANASVSASVGTAKKSVSGNVMKIEIEKNTTINNVSDFGTVYLSTEEEEGTYDVKISADILYSVKVVTETDSSVVEVSNVMEEKAVTVKTTEKKKTDTPSRQPSSSSSGISRPSADVPLTPTPDVPDTPATPEPPASDKFEFVDLNEASWAEKSVEKLLEKGIISESEDKKFNPNNNVKREEFIKMVVLANGIYNDAAECSFTDVSEDSWYNKYVASAYEKGIITGRDDGTFGEGEYITREEMAAIIYRANKETLAKPENIGGFSDDGEIAEWAKEAVYALKEQNIVNGMGDNLFAPGQNVTRAMTAKVIAGLIK